MSLDDKWAGPIHPEPSRALVVCDACHQRLDESYFEINRTIVCESCRKSIEDQLRGGWGFRRTARAGLFGLGASMAGVALYLPLLAFSSVDWSLIAILIGYGVGKLVRKGGGGLGGWACQLLAVGFTYLALGLSYFAFALLTFWQGNQPGLPAALSTEILRSILAQSFQLPLIRMRAIPIDIAFIGFGLWVAWRLNRPGRFVVTGPHQVEAGPVPS